jgi:sortase A
LLERTYTVTAIRVVLPQEVSLPAPTSDDALTLITCYPFGRSPHSPQRFVVRASPAGPSRSAQNSAATQFPFASFTHVPTAIGRHAFDE